MSGELLSREKYYQQSISQRPTRELLLAGVSAPAPAAPHHGAVDDLESFWWVLLWLCQSRGGPAVHREEFNPERQDKDAVEFRDRFRDTFEESPKTLGNFRLALFRTAEDTKIFMMINDVSSFCLPLKVLLFDFFEILRNAYRSNDFKDLHGTVIKLFEEQLDNLRKPEHQPKRDANMQTYYQSEVERRQNDSGDWNWTPVRQTERKGRLVDEDRTEEDEEEDRGPASPTQESKRLRTGARPTSMVSPRRE